MDDKAVISDKNITATGDINIASHDDAIYTRLEVEIEWERLLLLIKNLNIRLQSN